MKIFVDARWTQTEFHDGISRYGSSLLGALHKIHPITVLIHDEKQLAFLPKKIPYVIVNNPISPRELLLARKLNELGADIVFSPLQYMGIWGRKYKLILTLQDLICYRHPKPPTFLIWPVRVVWRLFHISYWPQRTLLNQADAIATVSHTSKKYIQHHNITKKPITVAYNAPSPLKVKLKKPAKKLVYMGSFMPYKNVETLIASLEYLPGYDLLLLSSINPRREKELVELAGKDARVEFFGGVSDKEYAEILGSAHALVTASKEEGFGLPIIEAMSVSVPVICSDIEIFHEVAGDAGLFFDPDSPKDFAKQVRKLEKKTIRAQMTKKGKAQAGKFTWKKSAQELLKTMKKLHKNGLKK